MSKKPAIIVDLDGTLCDVEHRVHYVKKEPKDWKSFHKGLVNDGLHSWCDKVIRNFHKDGFEIILLTGRDDTYREETLSWLSKNEVPYHQLFMRPGDDRRSDSIVKAEFFDEKISPGFEVLFVLEDRRSVVEMWRSKGLTCLQCDWGDF